jgi:LmbE family N-acetylglucosaminyl deacetylase
MSVDTHPNQASTAMTADSTTPDRVCLAVVVAHPDDDLRLCGGTVALHADCPGFRFVLVHATSGEAGMIAPGSSATPSTLGQTREAEARASWESLGRPPDRHEWLHYPDGGLAGLPAGELTRAIHTVLAAEHPHVVVTFGPDGVTGHPDHVAVSAATTEAFHRLRASSTSGFQRLVYGALPMSLVDLWDNGPAEAPAARPSEERPLYRLHGVPDDQINVSVDCSAVAPRLLTALRRHETQAHELACRSTEELLVPLSRETGVVAWPPDEHLLNDMFEHLDVATYERTRHGINDMHGAASVRLVCPPEAVYSLITDVDAMAQLSPECYSAEWSGGIDEPTVGATFTGRNRANGFEWTTVCEIVVVEQDRRFGFDAGVGERKHTRWMFDIVPEGAGCVITESFRFLALPPFLIGRSDDELAARTQELKEGISSTLTGLRQRLVDR